MVALDQPIAEVEVDGIDETRAAPQAEPPGPAKTISIAAPVPDAPEKTGRASPLARRLAREAGLDLSQIVGTGRRGRIMGDDVRALRTSGAANRDAGPLAVRLLPAQGAARTPVMMLHGLYDEGRGWRDLPDRLARAGHPVIVPDLPGHGGSLGAARTVEEAVDMLADLVPQGSIRLVGHSLGAALAAMIAARIGARVESLVLIAPAGLGARMDRDFLDIMAAADTPDALRRAMDLLGAGPISEAAMHLELDRLRAVRLAIRPLVQAVAADGVQQLDIAPVLARLTCPVSAVFGLDDRILDWRDCANLPAAAAIHLVRGAGHLPHTAAAELVAGLITGPAPLEREIGQARKG
jgi:pimeloyl-ACP methyl ester carboxylesterase